MRLAWLSRYKANHKERNMTTLKVIEVMTESEKSWEDAAQRAVNQADARRPDSDTRIHAVRGQHELGSHPEPHSHQPRR